MQTTRTLNPLPFEHLEPKRFEDLVRQLAYDFRPWQALEATGRTGSDEGFDARGFERLPDAASFEKGNRDPVPIELGRVWLIQCKRERIISPSKMRQHLSDIQLDPAQPLYGMIFAAACDFSKRTRDELRGWARDNGISEVLVWGKAEIEDLLFQPKNDNLLFSYFNISLVVRRRSIKTELRARLSIKRKCTKALEEAHDVLVRDAVDDRYPFYPEEEVEQAHEPAQWGVWKMIEVTPRGVALEIESYFAYVSDNKEEWDFIPNLNQTRPSESNMWRDAYLIPYSETETRARAFWRALPSRNRATLVKYVHFHFDQILDVDEDGDSAARFPHLYVEMPMNVTPKEALRLNEFESEIITGLDKLRRTAFFPSEFPAIDREPLIIPE